MFVKGYGNSWSRVLHEDKTIVEVDLTPLNGYVVHSQGGEMLMHTAVLEVAMCNIRRHMTRWGRDLHKKLPAEVRTEMMEFLGPQITHFLLTFDFMSWIHWGKYKRVSKAIGGGGVPFHLCANDSWHRSSTLEMIAISKVPI